MTSRPDSTYRLQITSSFTLEEAATVTGYLHRLGADWAYLSPLLAATDGSGHGYDVVDHSRIDDSRGGAAGLAAFSAAARAEGLGILVDIVPNHVGVAAPRQNPWWWDVLRLGRGSAHAIAFDIDWERGHDKVRLPILGGTSAEVLARGEIVVDPSQAPDAPDGTLSYFEHVLPLAPGTGRHSDDITALLDAQHYELRHWKDQNDELNYRRFFAVTELAAARVELPDVFAQSHEEIVRWIREGLADGIRVDHPDGLDDPEEYLERLADATGGAYTLIEKILEHGEELPPWWRTDGTTGYDALGEIDRVLIDPAGVDELTALDALWDKGTNLHHGLLLANRFFRRHPSMQPVLLVVTDGEPTAHLLPDGHAFFDYPPHPLTLGATVQELDTARRLGAQTTFFRLGEDPGLARFIDSMARRVDGRVVSPELDDLGAAVVGSYLGTRSGSAGPRSSDLFGGRGFWAG